MFTAENLEATWKQMRDYERDHFGLRFGEDYAAIAAILRQSKEFMTTGGVTMFVAALDMSGLSRSIKEAASEQEGKDRSRDLLEKPSSIHNTLAEMFYLGYELGRQTRETDILEQMQAGAGLRSGE